jgi:hypothetical protein
LGDILRIGQVFTLGNFLKITEVALIFGLTFFTVPVMFVLILAKNELGYILGGIFLQTHLVTLVTLVGLIVFTKSKKKIVFKTH